MVGTRVVLEINRRQDLVSGKTVKGRENVPQAENIAEQDNKVFLVLLPDNRFSQRIFLQ